MQVVSKAYKNSIAEKIRHRGYIKITIGVVNSDAENNRECLLSENDLAFFADNESLFTDNSSIKPYATCENNISKVDGSMYFIPDSAPYYDNGIVTNDFDDAIKITFKGQENLDIKGLMIDFSDNYPTEFTVDNGEITRTYTLDNRYFSTEDTFDDTDYLLITPVTMLNANTRFRIYSLTCGIANTFTNNEVINYSNNEFVSAITETIPSNDVSFTVDNQDEYYSPENPESALAYMEIGQEVKVQFGYDIDDMGTIEWVKPQKSFLKTWSANKREAKFTATDSFYRLDGTYYRGLYRPNGITLYDLALDVIRDAGIQSYFIDSYLKTLRVQNPIPPVSYGSALQIIANASRCTLSEDRKGRISIVSDFIPEMTASSDNAMPYSTPANVLFSNVDMYAEASQDYSAVDGTLKFAGTPYLTTIGYVSSAIANGSGNFATNPTLTLTLEASYAPISFGINFANTHATRFTIRTYADGSLVEEISAVNNSNEYVYDNNLEAFDTLVIEFTKGMPNSRVFVESLVIGSRSDYILRMNTELKDFPLAERQNKIKSISVVRQQYQTGSELKQIYSETLNVTPQTLVHKVYFSNPVHGLSLTIDTAGVSGSITDSSSYFAEITFSGISSDTDVQYHIDGYEYTIEEQIYTVEHNERGEEKKWTNPLISSLEMAKDLEEWLADFFLGEIEYQLDWRGDPRVDADDIFYLERPSELVPIRGYESTLNFSNQGWTGSLKARKIIE